MSNHRQGQRSRFVFSSISLLMTWALLLCVPGAVPPAYTQSTSAPVGISHWHGTMTQSPIAPGMTSGVWNVYVLMEVTSTGGVIMTSQFESQGPTGYWIMTTQGGTLSGSSLPYVGSAHAAVLPFGDFPCSVGGTATLTGTTYTYSGTPGGSGGCATTSVTEVLTNDSGADLGGCGCDPKATMAANQSNTPNEGSKAPKAMAAGPFNFVGDPIDIGTGNVFATFPDYATPGPNRLSFTRYYNSFTPVFANSPAFFVGHWRSNYDRYIDIVSSNEIVAERPNGRQVTFTLNGSTWTPPPGVDMTLVSSGGGSTWTLTDHDDTAETYTTPGIIAFGTFLFAGTVPVTTITYRGGYSQSIAYNSGGQPVSVTDTYGRQLNFAYSGGQLATLTTPDGLIITYGYSSSGIAPGVNDQLASVSYNTTPSTSMTYHYANASYPFALTSYTDENGNAQGNFTYDAYGRALTSSSAGGAHAVTVAYNDSTGDRTLTNALGQVDTYSFRMFGGTQHIVNLARTLSSTVINRAFTYDANDFLASAKDWNGNLTTFTNNTHGDPLSITEASGTAAARTTTIAYDPTFVHLPGTVTTPGLTTSFTYDASGNELTRTQTDTTTTSLPYSTGGQVRTWTKTWSSFLPASVTSPAGNTTAFTFDATGALATITNALSQMTTVTSHTGGGLPLSVTDPNGVVTNYTYDNRNRLLTKSIVTGAGPLVTTYTYDAAGNLLTATAPDGSAITNTYDTAGRLTKTADLLGNSLNLTLDVMGDVTATAIKNPSSTVTLSRTATYDAMGRKLSEKTGTTPIAWSSLYAWDNNGNMTSYTPSTEVGVGGATSAGYIYDALNRATSEAISPYGSISFTYDAHDRPLTITDRNGGVTTYTYDGFGDVIQQASPDSGTTVYHYDADGNTTSKTDALSHTVNTTYDTLDRPLTKTYPSDPTENVTYTYDQSGTGFTFGTGRLTSYTDAAGSHTRAYDERGNLTTDTLVTLASSLVTSYAYDNASRVASITYPSGVTTNYTRDSMGKVTGVSATPAGGSAQTLASSVTYEPFGPVTSFTYGNGITNTATYDLDYNTLTLKDIGTSSIQNTSYAYATGEEQASGYTDSLNSANTIGLNYDVKMRMLNVGTTGGAVNANNGWDANDNRTAYSGGASAIAATYTTHTNRLATYTIGTTPAVTVTTDAKGEITALTAPLVSITGATTAPGLVTAMSYTNAGQLASASGTSGVLGTYIYDAFGNRFAKTTTAGTTIFTYAPDGTLLEETSPSGAVRDYIYINGKPLALADLTTSHATTATYSYLHDDKMGTPRVATSQTQTVVWRGNYLPFGSPIATPSGTITLNLRMAGQYFDAESGLTNNGWRTYIPALERYAQPDPLGIKKGWNPYAYVSDRPWKFTDPLGMFEQCTPDNPTGAQSRWEHYQTDPDDRWQTNMQATGDGLQAIGLATGQPEIAAAGEALEGSVGGDSQAGGNTNPYNGPVTSPVIAVDQNGNAIPVNTGEKINTSPNGDYQQVIDSNGNPTGVRMDRGGHSTQSDPAAQGPHAHVPGVAQPNGNPHLPINGR